MLPFLLFANLGLIAFCYVGYPLLVAWQARRHPKPVQARDWQPRVDIVVVVYNGADDIVRKIDNVLAMDYPAEQLHVRIGSDGSGDDTIARAQSHIDQRGLASRITVTAFAQRRGKSACLGDLVAQSDAEIIVFTDVRQRLDANVVKSLVAPLADVSVGAVSGELMFESADGFGGSVDAYWRYEKFIRRNESASGSVVGVTGAIWAARRHVLPAIPGGLILDDVWLPLQIARRGLRILFCSDAIAWDRPSRDVEQEEKRKRRTLAGNYQLIARDPSLLWPASHPLGWRIWGHKWLRLASPWLFGIALLSNVALVGQGGFYALLLALQLGGWTLAAIGLAWPQSQRLLPLRIAALFARMNLFSALALFDYLRDRDAHLWAQSNAETRP